MLRIRIDVFGGNFSFYCARRRKKNVKYTYFNEYANCFHFQYIPCRGSFFSLARSFAPTTLILIVKEKEVKEIYFYQRLVYLIIFSCCGLCSIAFSRAIFNARFSQTALKTNIHRYQRTALIQLYQKNVSKNLEDPNSIVVIVDEKSYKSVQKHSRNTQRARHVFHLHLAYFAKYGINSHTLPTCVRTQNASFDWDGGDGGGCDVLTTDFYMLKLIWNILIRYLFKIIEEEPKCFSFRRFSLFLSLASSLFSVAIHHILQISLQ